MKINESIIKTWSRIGSRATFGMAALEIAKLEKELIILTADTSTSAGLDRFKKLYPEMYLDIGIAEQNMMGIAAGLSSEGFKVITSTFSPFQTMRCCEQIKVNLGYMNHNVCMVGLASGVVLGTLGYTHCCIEDIAIMRSIPGITVISPADCTETAKAVVSAVNYDRPVYIRLTGGAGNPAVYSKDYNYEIGIANTMRNGSDVTIFATGSMVHQSLEAANILSEQGISASVVNMHTIKPLDTKIINKSCQTSKLIVTVEEHSIIGGLGSAVAEYKSQLKNSPHQILIGFPDEYGESGDYNYLLEKYGLTAKNIVEKIKISIN